MESGANLTGTTLDLTSLLPEDRSYVTYAGGWVGGWVHGRGMVGWVVGVGKRGWGRMRVWIWVRVCVTWTSPVSAIHVGGLLPSASAAALSPLAALASCRTLVLSTLC